jgi:hypothetical protein
MERYILMGVLGLGAVLTYQAMATPAQNTAVDKKDKPGLSAGDYSQVPTNQTLRNQRALKKKKAGHGYKGSDYF